MSLPLVSEKKSKKNNPACNQKIVIKIVSEAGAPGLKSEKKNEYNTSGRINILFTAQLIFPFKTQTIGSAAIATNNTLQTIQLCSKLNKAEFKK